MDQTTFLLSSARFASSIARLCLGPLMPIFTVQLGFSDADKPALLSAYSSGYTSTQIVGGMLADKYGPISVVVGTVAASSVLLALMTRFTSASFWTKLFFILGLVGGPLFPAGSAAISTLVEMDRRAASAAIVDAAAALGTTAAALAPIIADRYGWRIVYYVTSVMLAIVAVGCMSQMKENKQIQSRSSSSVEKYPFQAILSPVALATFCCHSADNFARYSINAWASTMLTQQHLASNTVVGTILVVQEAAGVVSRLLTGVYGPKQASFASRGSWSAAAFVIQGLLQCLAFRAPSLFWSGLLFVLSSIAVGAHSVGFRPVYFEAAPEHAGSVSGFGNTVASLASAVGPIIVGYAQEVSWARVGWILMFINFIGCLSAMTIALTKKSPTPRWRTGSSKSNRRTPAGAKSS